MESKNAQSKIVILGGNAETGALVEVANSLGFYTVVIDPYPNAIAKLKAHKAYDMDVTDAVAVDEIIGLERPTGVLVGVADPLVPYYFQICKRNQLFCYVNEASLAAFTSKSNFADVCLQFDIPVTPNYRLDIENQSEVASLPYPVVAKPVDAGAGVGMSVVRNPADLRGAVQKCLEVSIRKEYILEKFMDCEDTLAYFTFVGGEVYLSAMADRYKASTKNDGSAVCVGAEYPSRHLERFLSDVYPNLKKMFRSLGLQNGVLLIQFFFEGEKFHAYDPGFRLQGEAPHIYLKHFNGFDHREMLLNFAVKNEMYDGDFNQANSCLFHGNYACTVWVILTSGTVAHIEGVHDLQSHPNVISVLTRFSVGDVITSDMLGTERQVFARVYLVGKSRGQLREVVHEIHSAIVVQDKFGADMIQARHDYQGV